MKLKADIIKSSYFAGEWQLSEFLYPETNIDFYKEKLPEGFSPCKSEAFLHQRLKDYKKDFDKGKKDFARKIQEIRKVNTVFVVWAALWSHIEMLTEQNESGDLLLFDPVEIIEKKTGLFGRLFGGKQPESPGVRYQVESMKMDDVLSKGLQFAYSQKEILEARDRALDQGYKTRYLQHKQFTIISSSGERAKIQNPVEVYFSGGTQVAVVVEGITDRNFFFELLETKIKIEKLDIPIIIQEYLKD